MITIHCVQDFTKKLKTLFNRTVCNCRLHPWLLYLSAHKKSILYSEVSIMSNEYTWIWICHHMCMFTCKTWTYICTCLYICREYTDKILLSPLSPLYILHHCSLHVCLFTVILLFSFLFLFSLFFYYHYFLYHPKILRKCYVSYLFHRQAPLIDCKIVIWDVFSFWLDPN